ncbi:MAG: alpha/beta hydrolase [Dehalococcoidales bacterium]|nr:alpha/beta hydrolase [Dehalococcoidales bacterium]
MKMLLIPGAGAGREPWVNQTGYFVGSEAIALPGHPDGEPCTSVEDYADWLHGYIQKQYFKDIVLVGHSMGGGIALTYAVKYPKDLKALILVGSGARLRVHPDFLNNFKNMINDAAAYKAFIEDAYKWATPGFKARMIASRLKINPAVMYNDFLCCDKFDIMARVGEIKVPTLIIVGSNDEMTPPKYAHFLATKIEGAKEVVIPGGTHPVYGEKPAEVNKAIEDFLSGLK